MAPYDLAEAAALRLPYDAFFSRANARSPSQDGRRLLPFTTRLATLTLPAVALSPTFPNAFPSTASVVTVALLLRNFPPRGCRNLPCRRLGHRVAVLGHRRPTPPPESSELRQPSRTPTLLGGGENGRR
nr:unnamed protein product [Digitaria exilis]